MADNRDATKSNLDQTVASLRSHLAAAEQQVERLKKELAEAEAQAEQAQALRSSSAKRPIDDEDPEQQQRERFWHGAGGMDAGVPDDFKNEIFAVLEQRASSKENHHAEQRWPLKLEEYRRYGRQLIMPEIGLQGQLRLKNAKVCVVGVGGLGCPAAAYLAGAGVGKLGLVDGDEVELSNLHRQVLHSEGRVGMSKVESAMVTLSGINSSVELVPHQERLSSSNAIRIFEGYDIVLDCTDTPASRYLISDACILLQIPLVSASALKTEGQLMMLNYPSAPPGSTLGGPCYRCVFPKPPPAESVVTCGEGGILGPVVGTMGILQALETIKVIAKLPGYATSSSNETPMELDDLVREGENRSTDPPSLLLFSAFSKPMFRSIRLRSRRILCAACGENATVTKEMLSSGSLDYVQFCGVTSPVAMLSREERVTARELAELRQQDVEGAVVVDVREKVQFELCSLPDSVNIPFSSITRYNADSTVAGEDNWQSVLRGMSPSSPIHVVCRLGNDSQVAVTKFKELDSSSGEDRYIGDVIGGLRAWRSSVDPGFPEY